MKDDKKHRRTYGVHYTPSEIFKEYIFPKISRQLWDFCWVDFYCGEGNLIFPILESIEPERREEFFKEHIYLSDIDAGKTYVYDILSDGKLSEKKLFCETLFF